jgi:hypothetical protein
MQATANPAEVRIVAMERGAHWDGLDREDAHAVFVVAQQAGESVTEFVQRVRRRLDELHTRGVVAGSAMFAMSSERGEHDAFSRFLLSHALVRCLDGGRQSELILLSSQAADTEERAAILTLAGELSRTRRTAVSVTVRFGSHDTDRDDDRALESGVRHSIPTLEPATHAKRA